MAKIVALITDPIEKGPTEKIVEQIMFSAMGYSLNTFKTAYARRYRYVSGCDLCNRCKDNQRCVINDDITPFLEDIIGCDSLIVSTPLVFGDMCSQLKTVIDRMYCILDADGKSIIGSEKKVAIVVSCNPGEEADGKYVAQLLQRILVDTFNFEHAGTILHVGGNILTEEQKDEAAVLGKKFDPVSGNMKDVYDKIS